MHGLRFWTVIAFLVAPFQIILNAAQIDTSRQINLNDVVEANRLSVSRIKTFVYDIRWSEEDTHGLNRVGQFEPGNIKGEGTVCGRGLFRRATCDVFMDWPGGGQSYIKQSAAVINGEYVAVRYYERKVQ